MKTRKGIVGALLLLGALPFAWAEPAAAQDGFLLKRPIGSFGLRIGYSMPRAGSDLFDFTTEQLTVDQSDFNGVAVFGDLSFRMGPRTDLTFNVGYTLSETRSEFRDWVGEDDLPIEQTTEFLTVPVTASVRYFLSNRGRSIGRFAWIPEKLNPYIGAGGGLVRYRFDQFGEFVDFETLDIFNEYFTSDGWAPTVHGIAGLEVSIGSRLLFTAEGRYAWASAALDQDFVDFEDLDLAGFQGSIGLGVRF